MVNAHNLFCDFENLLKNQISHIKILRITHFSLLLIARKIVKNSHIAKAKAHNFLLTKKEIVRILY